MSNQKYTLEIVSHHPKFDGKNLRRYYVDGIDTVGAWGNEPFEIRFKNNSHEKVQVKISLDGTDILTGKTADTQVSEKMWVVNAYDTLSLKAWPEDNNGGAGFVFTSADNSVAVHTHGNLSSRGIIAAAVFTEGQTYTWTLPVITNEQHHHHHHYDWSKHLKPSYEPFTIWCNTNTTNTAGSNILRSHQSFTPISGSMSAGACDSTYTVNSCATETDTSGSLEELVAIGAGEHVDQKITYVSGLTKPVFSETVRVRYLWWDDLVEKLRTATQAQPHASGFPGDAEKKNIDLKCTPRIKHKKATFRRAELQPVFDRF